MLKKLANPDQSFQWIVLHALLGVATSLVKEAFILWFLVGVLTSLRFIFQGSKESKRIYLVLFMSYFASMELLSRMAKAHQYKLPWEYGKYVILIGALYGMLVLGARKGVRGFLLFALLVPSIFFSPVYEITRHEIAFNLLGPIAMVIGIIFFYQLKITKESFKSVLRMIFFPAVSVLAYVIVRTPDYSEIEFELGANFQTAGGYGSNQVSTILGLGMFIAFLFWLNQWKLTGYRWVDLGLTLLFGFQGLLTFSRGGVLGAIIGIVVVVYVYSTSSFKLSKRFNVPTIGKFVLPSMFFFVIVFTIADNITDGLLTYRYTGESNATLAGRAEKDLNTLTTGRFDIFLMDVNLWQQHFITGAGVGASKFIRQDSFIGKKGEAAHVELSRLLAEHGMLGAIFFLLLLVTGFSLFRRDRNPKYQAILLALFMVAIYTTFHAAMRTYVTPLLVGLSLLSIVDINSEEAEKLHVKKRR